MRRDVVEALLRVAGEWNDETKLGRESVSFPQRSTQEPAQHTFINMTAMVRQMLR
jgi:hypothetical protein